MLDILNKITYPDELLLKKSDIGFIFGSPHHQDELANAAFDLYSGSLIKKVVVSGWNGEASDIKIKLVKLGFPVDDIYLEECASNTLENILFSKDLIQSLVNNVEPSMLLICKNYSAKRCLLTVKKHLPKLLVSVLTITFHNVSQVNWFNNKAYVEKILLEINKIYKYSKSGDIAVCDDLTGLEYQQIEHYLGAVSKISES